MTEKEFMQAVTALAKTLGYVVYHTHRSDRSEPGFPDLVLAGRGRVLFRELKVGKNQLTPAQQNWLTALRKAGANAAAYYGDTDWPALVQRDLENRGLDISRHQSLPGPVRP